MPAKVTLTITEGKLKGKEFPFDSRSTCFIGRHPDCNIPIPNDLDHKTISRYHCFLDINPPDIRVRDLGSLHGTYAAILIMKMTITILENMSSIKLNSFMSQLNFTGLISHLSF